MERSEVINKINTALATHETMLRVKEYDFKESNSIQVYTTDCFVEQAINIHSSFYNVIETVIKKMKLPKPNYNNSGLIFWCWKDNQTLAWN